VVVGEWGECCRAKERAEVVKVVSGTGTLAKRRVGIPYNTGR
jgi:hypothetical protein